MTTVLTGCGWQGDFGRPQQSDLYRAVKDRASSLSLASIRENASALRTRLLDNTYSDFALTDDELDLRRAAVHFETQTHNLVPLASSRNFDTAYADYMKSAKFGSARTRSAEFLQNLRQDHAQLDVFDEAVRRVLAADANRHASMTASNPVLSPRDRRRAALRVRQNLRLMSQVIDNLRRRVMAYETAVERSRLETPGGTFNETSALLDLLRERLESLQGRIAVWRKRFVFPNPRDVQPEAVGDLQLSLKDEPPDDR